MLVPEALRIPLAGDLVVVCLVGPWQLVAEDRLIAMLDSRPIVRHLLVFGPTIPTTGIAHLTAGVAKVGTYPCASIVP